MKRPYLFLVCLFFFEACSGGGSSSPQAVSGVLISPRPLAAQKGGTLQLAAKDLSGQMIPQSSLTWSVDGTSINGTVNSNGLYSAPANIPPQNPVTVRAASAADSTKNDAISFYILTGSVPSFSTPYDITGTINPQGTPLGFHMAVFNQNSYVTWAISSGIYGTHLWYSKGDLNGNFSTPHDLLGDLLNYTVINRTVKNPVIALDNTVDSSGDPGVYIAWDDNSNGPYQVNLVKGPNSISTNCINPPICFTPFALTGTGNATSLHVYSSTSDQTQPSLAMSSMGKLEFAWTEVYGTSPTPSQFIIYKELNSNGSASTPQSIRVASATPDLQVDPAIEVDFSGNVSVSWLDYNSGTFPPNIVYSRLRLGQSAFDSWVPVESVALGPSDTFSMALDNYGQPHLAWSKSSSGTPTGIYYSTTADFSQFTTPVQLTSGGVNPTIKVDLLNDLYFSWNDSAATYFKKIGASPSPLSLASPQLSVSGVNSVMNIDNGGRVYLLYSTTGSTTLSAYFMRGK